MKSRPPVFECFTKRSFRKAPTRRWYASRDDSKIANFSLWLSRRIEELFHRILTKQIGQIQMRWSRLYSSVSTLMRVDDFLWGSSCKFLNKLWKPESLVKIGTIPRRNVALGDSTIHRQGKRLEDWKFCEKKSQSKSHSCMCQQEMRDSTHIWRREESEINHWQSPMVSKCCSTRSQLSSCFSCGETQQQPRY